MPNIKEKKPISQTTFLTPTASNKAKFVKFGVKKSQSGNPAVFAKSYRLLQ